MKSIKEYYCDNTPTEEELKTSLNICKRHKCVVKLCWFIKYNGWNYQYICEDSDIEKINDSLRHVVYGL